MPNDIVSREDWLAARLELLSAEKALTRQREDVAAKRRALPWTRVDKDYRFESPEGPRTLAGLFDGRSQLVIYHFMLGPDWTAGCKSCSFWADSFEGTAIHLAHRDVTFAAVSRAPLERIEAYRRRMGWTFPWFSSHGSDFNYDYGVSFTAGQIADGSATYNYASETAEGEEMPGISVFCRDPEGTVFHTYSTYGRGIDAVNTAYQLLDLVPKGRDEGGLEFTMAWVCRHDEY